MYAEESTTDATSTKAGVIPFIDGPGYDAKLKSHGMYYLAGTNQNGLEASDQIGVNAEAEQVYSYMYLGNDA